jgi:protein-tyrosine phosphatase
LNGGEPAGGEKRPWGRAALLLALLGPFFFASYGFATWYTSRLQEVPSLVFGWEQRIPLWPWTIVPYWSVDLFYALSFFICTSRAELYTHAKRLLAAQLISVSFFLLLPLRFTFERPPMEGILGSMFAALMEFDKPFNQAPSLHISLLLILWLRYSAHLGKWGRLLLHGWFALIGLSVLTTWQHHFIDLPTGFAAGALCIVLFPDSPGAGQRDPRRFRLAAFYGIGALGLGGVALIAGREHPGWLWIFWPAASLLLVAVIYLRGLPGAFGKEGGRLAWPLAVALAPYLAAAFLNSRLWTRAAPGPVEVADGVFLGRCPARGDLAAGGFRSLVDLSAELPVEPDGLAYRAVPMLDLLVAEPRQVAAAARAIAELEGARPTLVFCALGYSRGAMAVAAWLLASGRAGDAAEAIGQIAALRPRIVLGAAHREALELLLDATAAAPRPRRQMGSLKK